MWTYVDSGQPHQNSIVDTVCSSNNVTYFIIVFHISTFLVVHTHLSIYLFLNRGSYLPYVDDYPRRKQGGHRAVPGRLVFSK